MRHSIDYLKLPESKGLNMSDYSKSAMYGAISLTALGLLVFLSMQGPRKRSQ